MTGREIVDGREMANRLMCREMGDGRQRGGGLADPNPDVLRCDYPSVDAATEIAQFTGEHC